MVQNDEGDSLTQYVPFDDHEIDEGEAGEGSSVCCSKKCVARSFGFLASLIFGLGAWYLREKGGIWSIIFFARKWSHDIDTTGVRSDSCNEFVG